MNSDHAKLTPTQRLQRIADILVQHDNELLAIDGPVPQEPAFLRQIYLLAIGKISRREAERANHR